MKSYNKYIADLVYKNLDEYIENTPQPETISTQQNRDQYPQQLYGGKRVRAHPQPGHTAYSQDPTNLMTNNNLLLNNSSYSGGSFWDDMGNTFKSVGNEVLHDVVLPVAKDVGKEALTTYLKGSGIKTHIIKKSRGRPSKKGGDILGDLGNIGKSVLSEVSPILKEVAKDSLKSYVKGSGRGRGRPSKKKGGDIGSDILNGIKEVAPIVAPLLMGLGRKTTKKSLKGGAAELYPKAVVGGALSKKSSRGELIKKIMKTHGLNLPQASKYIKENNLKY